MKGGSLSMSKTDERLYQIACAFPALKHKGVEQGRIPNTRQWAVWKGEQLIAVVCYKKGAKTLKQVLADLLNKPADGKQTK